MIERRLGIRLALSTVQLYLGRWGLGNEPAKAAVAGTAAIAARLEQDYPAIAIGIPMAACCHGVAQRARSAKGW